MNQLVLGDNLEILKKLDSESVVLVYLDPRQQYIECKVVENMEVVKLKVNGVVEKG